MIRVPFCRRLAVLLMAPLLAACQGDRDYPEAPRASRPVELPRLGDYLPPLDRGRIEIAPPAGWHVPPRDNRFVARFTKSRGRSYPSIILRAEDAPETPDVTKEDVETFAAWLEKELDSKGDPQGNGPTRVTPVRTGGFVGAMYRKQGSTRVDIKTIVLDRLLMETVVGRRKYLLELRASEGTLEEYRPALLAVAGGMKFLDRTTED